MVDPSTQYLETCPNIGTPRFRGQDIEKQEKDFQAYRAAQRKNLPSPSSHVDEKNVFSIDKLVSKKPEERFYEGT